MMPGNFDFEKYETKNKPDESANVSHFNSVLELSVEPTLGNQNNS